jgi:hypothetical protein
VSLSIAFAVAAFVIGGDDVRVVAVATAQNRMRQLDLKKSMSRSFYSNRSGRSGGITPAATPRSPPAKSVRGRSGSNSGAGPSQPLLAEVKLSSTSFHESFFDDIATVRRVRVVAHAPSCHLVLVLMFFLVVLLWMLLLLSRIVFVCSQASATIQISDEELALLRKALVSRESLFQHD